MTVFPLMITAMTRSGGGDEASTLMGATLGLASRNGPRTLTVNNPAVEVSGETTTLAFPYSGRVGVDVKGLEYTLYGTWAIRPRSGHWWVENGAAWLGGHATQAADLPVSGAAVYRGNVTGLHSWDASLGAHIEGEVSLTGDFASRTVSGAMNNLRVFALDLSDFPYEAGRLNDIGFTAALDPARNVFTGTTRVIGEGAGGAKASAFSANATGAISGRFFGPAAREVGGVWTLTDGTLSVIGAFGAKQ
jgi:hypothetical protein